MNMPQPGTIIGAFTDELGELGKQIVRETVQVPKDIAGKALESLGASGGKKSNPKSLADPVGGALPRLDEAGSQQAKQAIARAALAEFAGAKPKQKEPSVWEQQQAEAERKKELSAQQQKQAAAQALPVVKFKRPRGDLFGIKSKRFGGEAGKNVRQD